MGGGIYPTPLLLRLMVNILVFVECFQTERMETI